CANLVHIRDGNARPFRCESQRRSPPNAGRRTRHQCHTPVQPSSHHPPPAWSSVEHGRLTSLLLHWSPVRSVGQRPWCHLLQRREELMSGTPWMRLLLAAALT